MAEKVQVETTVRPAGRGVHRQLFAPIDPRDRREPTARDQRTDIPARSAWSYHDRKGWDMIDRVLPGEVTPEALAAARFSAQPTWTLGSPGDACHAAVYPAVASANSADELVIFTAGHRQYQIVAKGLPALLEVLRTLKDLGAGEAGTEETPAGSKPARAARAAKKK